jgi:hypothetical protein
LHNLNQPKDHGLLVIIKNNESNFVLTHKHCDTLQCSISRVRHESKHVTSFAISKCVNKRKKWFQNKYSNFESKSLHFKYSWAFDFQLNSTYNVMVILMVTCSASNKCQYPLVWLKTHHFTTSVKVFMTPWKIAHVKLKGNLVCKWKNCFK